ncbi:MAG: YdbH domain-containing protein [Candidatus Omnitrophica bacterium]|nr:YdbH domain-containing protein [Candidatus Omnitrophota bacterium]
MKKPAFYKLLIVLALCLAVFSVVFVKQLVLGLVKKQLSAVCPGSSVVIAGLKLRPFTEVVFSGIELSKKGVYRITCKEAGVNWSPVLLLRGKIKMVALRNTEVLVSLGDKSILSLKDSFRLPAGPKAGFALASVSLENMKLDIGASDLVLRGEFSAKAGLGTTLSGALNLRAGEIEASGFKVKNVLLEIKENAPGALFIEEAGYNKAKIRALKSPVAFEDNALAFDDISADFLGGNVRGKARFSFDAEPRYDAEVKFSSLDTAVLAYDFELNEKVELTGKMSGTLKAQGTFKEISLLSGSFSADAPGGVLTLKDTSYLQGVADASQQPLDIVIESFRNYRYNTGIAQVSLEEKAVKLEAHLAGEAGKRSWTVVLHDFQSHKEGL